MPEGCRLSAETAPGLPHSLTVKSWSVSPAGCRSLTPPIWVVFYSLQDAFLGFLLSQQLWESSLFPFYR